MEDISKRKKEIKDLQETNQNLVNKLGDIEIIRQFVTVINEDKWELRIAKQKKNDLLKNDQNYLRKESGKISRKINKCERKHNDVKNELKEKIDLIKIIKTMKENIETEKRKAAEHRKGVKRKPEELAKHKTKKLKLSKDKKRNDVSRIVYTSNESYRETRMNSEATDDPKQTHASERFEETSLAEASGTNKNQFLSTLQISNDVKFDDFISKNSQFPTNTTPRLKVVKLVRSASTTKTTGVQNAGDQEVNSIGPPNKKSKSSDVFPGTKKM